MSSTIELAEPHIQQLYQLACAAREKAYCPYSGYQVGAAIRISDGTIYTGCNVENSSYGATNCAERVAIQKAVSEHGKIQIADVMVVTDANPPWPPCGMCRQVIAEFSAQTVIHAANLQGEIITTSFADLLPQAFTPEHLHR
ncbi:MAG: cytidine deaminase [Abitibacteriaceae bacterium]|nr:cytidine deaminase [Abditibacteriaceae bacterium]MBV9865223.1 cytidine deaminase [Abditibacteriaceae bacterium]